MIYIQQNITPISRLKLIIIFGGFSLLFAINLHSQTKAETVIYGHIVRDLDKTPIGGVNVYFNNTNRTVQSDNDGYFYISTMERTRELYFSCVGYKTEKISFQLGQTIEIEVRMREMDNQLQEIFVLPGTNPALDIMKRIRMVRSKNDVTNYKNFSASLNQQNRMLLGKLKAKNLGKHLYNQLKKGNLGKNDSILTIPLYISDKVYYQKGKSIFETYSDPKYSLKSEQIMVGKLLNDNQQNINFYDNTINILGKTLISPLASIGGVYYDYYLADSTVMDGLKQYRIDFRTKNKKNLAFIGRMWIDSISLSLVSIDAELPDQANINYIHNLRIVQNYRQMDHRWFPHNQEMALHMTYYKPKDTLNTPSEIFIKQSVSYTYSDSLKIKSAYFSETDYDTLSLTQKYNILGNTPIMRTAKWIADAALTGYMKIGIFDVGSIPQLMRTTNIEGFRFNLPLRTNEVVWKNVSVGGYLGYGIQNHSFSYMTFGQWKLKTKKRRVFEIKYTDDHRRIDYNYNDFINTENPLNTGDEDMFTTLFSFWSADRLNHRKEIELSFSNDWTRNLESTLYIRSNLLFPYQNIFPMIASSGVSVNSLRVNSVTTSTRLSFNEKKYEDHTRRIYISNDYPVLYFIFEGGQYLYSGKKGYYGKFLGCMRKTKHTEIGDLEYTLSAGTLLGNVPYPLLHFPSGTEAGGFGLNQLTPAPVTGSGGYSLAHFNMMKYLEYASDSYIELHSQFITNGLIFNQIPFIKYLNLREMFSFKIVYGTLSSKHTKIFKFPEQMDKLNSPYIEMGAGLTNILRIFSLQSVWRFTDTNHPNVKPWGLRLGLNISF